jgi:hypothetical protein
MIRAKKSPVITSNHREFTEEYPAQIIAPFFGANSRYFRHLAE